MTQSTSKLGFQPMRAVLSVANGGLLWGWPQDINKSMNKTSKANTSLSGQICLDLNADGTKHADQIDSNTIVDQRLTSQFIIYTYIFFV